MSAWFVYGSAPFEHNHEAATLVSEIRKPFDVLAERLISIIGATGFEPVGALPLAIHSPFRMPRCGARRSDDTQRAQGGLRCFGRSDRRANGSEPYTNLNLGPCWRNG